MSHPCILNNAATDAIEQKDYDGAISTLTKALKKVKLVMSGDAMISRFGAMDEDDDSNITPIRLTGFYCEFVSTDPSSSFERTFEHGGICSSSIFRDPVYISPQLPRSELEKCELISHVILYNLGLSYHLKAMDEEEEHRRLAYLAKALMLYEHAHHLLSNQEIDVSIMHTMAISCNLGHIHHIAGDDERARMCSQHLLSTILYVVDCGEAHGKMKALDGFFRNVMPLIGIVSSAPAA